MTKKPKYDDSRPPKTYDEAVSCARAWRVNATNPRALASALGSTPEFAQAVCNVLDKLSSDELERTPTPDLAERIVAEHERILSDQTARFVP